MLCYCIGDSFSVVGKSFFTRWLLYHMRDVFYQCYVFTNTKINGYWQTMVPDRFIFNGVQEGVLINIIERQKKLVKYCYDHPEFQINPRMVIIFDDVCRLRLHVYSFFNTLFTPRSSTRIW